MIRMKLVSFLILQLVWLMVSINGVQSQTDTGAPETSRSEGSTLSLSVGADLVSQYVWRGIDYGRSPAVQPTLSLDVAGFSVGAWGSYAFSRCSVDLNDSVSVDYHYSEVDLSLSYTFRFVTILLVDYYAPPPVDTIPAANYFNYTNSTTGHTLEVALQINGPDRIPFQFLVSTLIYGADKGKDSTGQYGSGNRNNYSTYLEFSYPLEVKRFTITPYVGGIPFGSSWYGPKAGITNIGLLVGTGIPFSKSYTMPISSNLIFNPLLKKVYLVFSLIL